MARSKRPAGSTTQEIRDACPVSDWLDEDDCAEWLAREELIERGDVSGLIRHCEVEVRERPNDPYARYRLAQAYLRGSQAQKALDLLTPKHRRQPEERAYQEAILDALFASGQTERDFTWTVCPPVYRLTPVFIDACYTYLKSRPQEPVVVTEIWVEMTAGGYAAFSDSELLAALCRDARFHVTHPPGLREISLIGLNPKPEG